MVATRSTLEEQSIESPPEAGGGTTKTSGNGTVGFAEGASATLPLSESIELAEGGVGKVGGVGSVGGWLFGAVCIGISINVVLQRERLLTLRIVESFVWTKMITESLSV
jgi:hypothetical protein